MLAAQAQQLANNDVQNAQRAYLNRYGGGVGGSSNMGAVIGGIRTVWPAFTRVLAFARAPSTRISPANKR